jgi:Regulator of G protein signaling domain
MGSKHSKKTNPPAVKKRINSKLEIPVVDMKKFMEFCESRRAGENVQFYMAVVNYEGLFEKKAAQEDIIKAAEQIVLQFLSSKSPSEIALDDTIRKKIFQVYEKSTWEKDSFRAARIEVVTTLTDQMMPAYEKEWLKSRSG